MFGSHAWGAAPRRSAPERIGKMLWAPGELPYRPVALAKLEGHRHRPFPKGVLKEGGLTRA